MTSKTYTEEEIANLSDDEVMGMAIPPTMAAEPAKELEPPADPDDVEEGADPEKASAADDDGDDPDEEIEGAGDAGGASSAPAEEATTAPATEDPAKKQDPDAADAEPKKDGKAKEPQTPAVEPVDYKGFYERVMSSFRANGKEIKLTDPEDAVRLMQMGANYTVKLQALQPQLRLVKMLQNNGLLDEGKLSYLIDLDKKNPAAIQKLLKESGVDPLEIDTSAEPNYKPGDHRVSDSDMAFQSAVDELMLDDVGQRTLVTINKTWDDNSKAALRKEPHLLSVIKAQQENGIYQKISDEIDRQKMLGRIPPSQSFIQTYLMVGKDMDSRGLLGTPAAAVVQPGRVVDTRPASRPSKPAVTNNDKARAASPTATSPKKVVADHNPLSMSDEDFEKAAALAQKL